MSRLKITAQNELQPVGKVISWIGLCPWTNDLAFGTEDGELHYLQLAKVPGVLSTRSAGISTEPINGAAFSGDWACVTTREDITFVHNLNSEFRRHSFGAHDAVPLMLGGFLATLGPDGLLVARFEPSGDLTAMIASPSRPNLNSYRACSLGVVDGIEYLACASRRGGLMTGQVPHQMASPKVHGAGAHDFVDVCSLGSAEWPFAAVALAIDGTLFFGRDLMSEPGVVMHFPEFHVRAYSLRHIGDHLIILTSEGLLLFPGLAADYLAGRRKVRQSCTRVSIEASEVFSIRKDLYLLEGDGAVAFSVESLIDQAAGQTTMDRVTDWHVQGRPEVLPPMPEHPLAA